MNRVMIGIAVTLSVLGGIAFGEAVLAQESQSNCSISGTAVLQGIPDTKDGLAPSVGREIAGYGRQAKASDCSISLVCVARDGGDTSREFARQQCVVVRDHLVSAGFAKANISTSRKNPGGSFAAGAVYLSVQ
ncbi:hypothetical protein [Devosia nitrariae]|uniref:Uncharacterized protein n=1 Tax=Devosia nitrariae TaxID=2071872 RepID=A0ABQ5WED8_9HYPH|nr:hypothetical protein [Devosia nitrariae]GLQ57946.1 hypothetical protein GCM10010862_52050 [Devosia nitrariae]